MPLTLHERRCLACGEFLPPGTNAGRWLEFEGTRCGAKAAA